MEKIETTNSNTGTSTIACCVPTELKNTRLDQALAILLPEYSRSQLQKWIKAGQVLCNDKKLKPREKMRGGEQLRITLKPSTQTVLEPENIPLDIVHADDSVLIVNKPTGLVVHPAAGNWQGTLVNALLWHYPEQKQLPRAGIVHRLDKDTTGLMVVARTLPAHKKLVDQLQQREIKREYLALVQGEIISGGEIETNIGRHPRDRKRMAVLVSAGKLARTYYRVQQRFSHYTLLKVKLETGRTHQIRVHMAHKHMPIVGDPVYGGRLRLPKNSSEAWKQSLQTFKRQALHATQLGLQHPETNQWIEWQVDMPKDMQALIHQLGQHNDNE